ncbi:MAG: formylglycine-generating enzyme family protein [Rubripirellula sp.]|nr:formylglycine-generating enzyme family protein [Rubripirellula sp.]
MMQFTNSIGMQFTLIPSVGFRMGNNTGDKDEQPIHEATLIRDFYLATYAVTQRQYEQVMGKNLSTFRGLKHPVERVNWHDSITFFRRLSRLPEEQVTGNVYRLPSEAAWEYACRAGTESHYCFGNDKVVAIEYSGLRNGIGTTPTNRQSLCPVVRQSVFGHDCCG